MPVEVETQRLEVVLDLLSGLKAELGFKLSLDSRHPETLAGALEKFPIDWINDVMRPLLHAIPPRSSAEIALRTAEDTDARVASLGPDSWPKLWPADPSSPLNPSRADHRGEHLDEIERALGL